MCRVSLNGVLVYPFSKEEDLLQYLETFKGILIAINAEKILNATEQTRQIINNNLGYCDGMGAVWAVRQAGFSTVHKIAGCELWLKLIEHFQTSKTFYLIGAKPEVLKVTLDKIKKEFPAINIVGSHDGYLSSSSIRESVINDVVDKKPDVVFVAMGSPQQEILMQEIQQRHQAIFQGLGGSFDVYTNTVKRCPNWLIKCNLEFLYRLIKQPKRIKRQLPLIKFAWWLVTRKFKREQSFKLTGKGGL